MYKELFENVGETYGFSTENELDNNLSMQYFLEMYDVPEDAIIEDEGTQVILSHPDFNFMIALDSHGTGDFYSHAVEISTYDGYAEYSE